MASGFNSTRRLGLRLYGTCSICVTLARLSHPPLSSLPPTAATIARRCHARIVPGPLYLPPLLPYGGDPEILELFPASCRALTLHKGMASYPTESEAERNQRDPDSDGAVLPRSDPRRFPARLARVAARAPKYIQGSLRLFSSRSRRRAREMLSE